jgi:hypothetical protein
MSYLLERGDYLGDPGKVVEDEARVRVLALGRQADGLADVAGQHLKLELRRGRFPDVGRPDGRVADLPLERDVAEVGGQLEKDVDQQPGTGVMIFKTFSPKKGNKIVFFN